MTPLLYETHMHTPLCRHAEGEPEEYADAAARRGLAGIVVTCHAPMPDGFAPSIRMRPDELPDYIALVERARSRCRGTVDVRLGLECEFFPGFEDFVAEQVRSAPFDYILGSVHPHTREYLRRFFRGDAVDFQRTYFTHLAEAAETGLYDCLTHPDLVKNNFPEEWDLERIFDHVCACLDRVAATGVAMELNTSGLQKSIAEFNPSGRILAEMRRREIPVVIGADAHTPERVAADFEDAFDALEEARYEHVSLFLERRRRDVSIEDGRRSLAGGSERPATAGPRAPARPGP